MLNPNLLKRQVTMFANITETKTPHSVSVEQVIGRTQTPNESTSGLISKIRSGENVSENKKRLPVILWSGIFSERSDSAIEEHSGLIVIDFDHVDVENVKASLAYDEYTFICYTSPSGNGVKAVIQISNPERHRDHFRAAVKYYENQYGLSVDTSGVNESRACYESYDPDVLVNPNAKVFGHMLTERAEAQKVEAPKDVVTDYDNLNIAVRMIRKAADGEKHSVLLRAARLCGGYIEIGRMEEDEVHRVLLREIQKKNIESVENARQTIDYGIQEGRKMPIKELLEERDKAQREMKINDGDMSFISSDDEDFRWINDFAEGRIKMGLDTGVPALDEHFRFKKNFSIINGHSNIGKTTFAAYLQVVSAMRHGWKWMMYTSENKTASQKMKLMSFAMGISVNQMNYQQRKMAFEWVNKHFTFIDNKSVYSYSDILLFAEKLMRNQELDGIFIDPYNSLRRDIGAGSKLGVHEYDYEATSEMLTFSNAHNVAVWLNTHAVTEAQRMKGDDGLPIAPFAEQTEGGGKFVNRADDFFTFHRKIQHPDPTMRKTVEFHVRKVRETETGGSPTPLDGPILFEMNYNGSAFYHVGSGSKMFTPLHEAQNTVQQLQTTDFEVGSVDDAF